ncbi:MAG: hypothetical protein ACFNT8_05730 [Prevotella sp.]
MVRVVWRPWYARAMADVTSVSYRGGMDFMVYTGARYVVKEAMMRREVQKGVAK